MLVATTHQRWARMLYGVALPSMAAVHCSVKEDDPHLESRWCGSWCLLFPGVVGSLFSPSLCNAMTIYGYVTQAWSIHTATQGSHSVRVFSIGFVKWVTYLIMWAWILSKQPVLYNRGWHPNSTNSSLPSGSSYLIDLMQLNGARRCASSYWSNTNNKKCTNLPNSLWTSLRWTSSLRQQKWFAVSD